MMPVAAAPAAPAQPTSRQGAPVATPATLDFTALLLGEPIVPMPVIAEDTALPAQLALPDLERQEPEIEPLPAPPPLLAMLQPPIQPAAVPLPIQHDAPRPARGPGALPAMLAPAPAAEPAPSAALAVQDAPSSTPPVDIASVDAPPAAPDPQPVAIAAPHQRPMQGDAPQVPIDTTDPRWIGRMADEITRMADGDGRARFRLNPENLGSMEVTMRHTADGISVRFAVESESTRALIAQVEHRLQAEARANGVRIADTQVDLTNQQQRDGRDRPTEQPLIAIRSGSVATAIQSTPSAEGEPASARYA